MERPTTLKLRPEALAQLRREAVSLAVLALAATATAVLAMQSRTRSTQDLAVAGLLIAVAGAVAILVDVRGRRRAWEAFSVTLGADGVEVSTRRGVRRLTRGEVEGVVATVWPANGLVLRAAGHPPLFLPAALERFDEVRATVAGWAPLERSRVPEALVRMGPAVVVATCALEAVAIGGPRGPGVAAASTVLALAGLWGVSNALRSRRLSLRARVLSLLLLVPVAYLVWRAWTSFGS